MKKGLVLLFVLSLLTSCDSSSSESFKISTSFAPLYDFTKSIVKDKMEVINIVEDNEPHGFSFNDPKKAAFTEKADLVVSYGHTIDTWINSLNPSKTFNCTSNIEFKKENGVEDPHAYLSIANACIMIENIYQEIIKIDSSNLEYYSTNKEEYISKLVELDNQYKEKLSSNLSSNILLTSHEAFYYLASSYNLTQVGIADIANNQVTATQINKIVNYIKQNNIKTIFVEKLDDSKNVNLIQEELKSSSYTVNIDTLNAFEGFKVSEFENDNYYAALKTNLEKIYEALK